MFSRVSGPARKLALAFCTALTLAVAQESTAQSAAAPTVHMVTVAPSVALEVLDSGGSGPPLLLLSQLGHTAHVYDGWTTRLLRDRFRVIAVTRRGYGASSHPASGYDSATLVRDLVAVLDSLRLDRVTVVGHEVGVTEAVLLAARHPQRVERLVFLGPAVDFKKYIAQLVERKAPGLPEPAVGDYDQETVAGLVLAAERTSGPAFPESEVRAMFQFGPDGVITGSNSYSGASAAIVAGLESLDGVSITAPALNVGLGRTSVEVQYPYWQDLDQGERATARQLAEIQAEIEGPLRASFVKTVPALTTVAINGARRYVFLTHPGEVTQELLTFVKASR